MFEIPSAFQIALAGVLTYLIVKGMQNRLPQLEGPRALLASAIVATFVSTLTGLINTHVDPSFFPILREVFILLAAWLSAIGTKQVEKVICGIKRSSFGGAWFLAPPNELTSVGKMATRVINLE
jgi:hypothetical protein